MLRALRYFVIIFSILTQAALAVLGIGNILSHVPASVFATVNACVAVSGLASSVFMTVVFMLELAQKEETTSSALFEILWVGMIWIATTLEASWLSTANILGCDAAADSPKAGWNVCFSQRIGVPLAWSAAFFATAQLVIVVMLIEWHRAQAPSDTPEQPLVPRSGIQRVWTNVVKPEINALAPILSKSVYVLLIERRDPRIQTRRFYDHRRTFMSRVSRAFQKPSMDKSLDDRLKLRWADEERGPGEWTGSYYFQTNEASPNPKAPVNAPLPVFAPTVRLPDIPRYQLYDAPVPRVPSTVDLNTPILQAKVASSSKNSRTPSTSSQRRSQRRNVQPPTPAPNRTRELVPASPQLSASPSSPRFPARSRTLPSPAVPPRAQLPGTTSSALRGPVLTRSATVGARRFDIPSRYKDLDWTPQEVRTSFAAPLPPPGFLPRPNARY